MKKKIDLTEAQVDRIIEMAWEDRTPFEAILIQFGLKEQDVISLMRREMKSSSFKMWRARVQGRALSIKTNVLMTQRPFDVQDRKELVIIKFLNAKF